LLNSYIVFLGQNDGEIEADVNRCIQAEWLKGRRASCILCHTKVPVKLKGTLNRTVVRPTMLYGLECQMVKNKHENKVSVAETRILRWMCSKTRWNRIRNDNIRERV